MHDIDMSLAATICDKVQDTFSPLRCINQIFSLNCGIANKTRCQLIGIVVKATVTATVLGFLNFYTLFVKIRDYYDRINLSIKVTDTIQMCYDYSQYLVDLYFVFKYGRETYSEYYKQYVYIDQILEITDYSSIKKRLIKLIQYFIVIWLGSSIFDFSAWSLSYGLFLPTLYSISYIFVLIKMLNVLDLTSHVMHIEFRLSFITCQLQSCYYSTKSLPGNFNDLISNKNWFYCGNSMSSNVATPAGVILVARDNCQVVKWLTRCYLLIIEQCVFINKMFGIRILLNSLSLLIDMIRFTNIAVRLIIGSQVTLYDSGYYPAAANLLRMVTCGVVVTSLVAHCERAYRQADATLAVIDHTLVNKDPDGELRGVLAELRGLVQSRRVDYHMAYFFRLDYSLLVSIASVVVTYTIILLQSLPN